MDWRCLFIKYWRNGSGHHLGHHPQHVGRLPTEYLAASQIRPRPSPGATCATVTSSPGQHPISTNAMAASGHSMCPITPFHRSFQRRSAFMTTNVPYLSYASPNTVFRMNPNNVFIGLCLLMALTASLHAQELVSPHRRTHRNRPQLHGNKAIRMAMNVAGEPVIAFGTNGHLYVTRWDASLMASRTHRNRPRRKRVHVRCGRSTTGEPRRLCGADVPTRAMGDRYATCIPPTRCNME